MPTRAIQAIFYTRFHPEKGSRVLHQVPDGSITPSTSPSALPEPLIPFESVATYLIPTQQFCDRLLTFCTNHYRVIGYPVCIREGKYNRNEFIFNFAVVIEEGIADWACWGEVVRKLGRLLRGLEEQGGFLSREESGVWDDEGEKESNSIWSGLNRSESVDRMMDVGGFAYPLAGGGSKVYALCEMILEDLNNYCECMIPIDESNTINLKLFPAHPPPAPIYAYHVPILTISLSALKSPITSDLTLNRILPYVNGINSVSRIAQVADTDLSLTRKAVQHLVYHGCVVLLDVFQFNAIYAPTAEIGEFIIDKSMGEECGRYVKVPRLILGRSKKPAETDRPRDDRSSLSSDTFSQRSEVNIGVDLEHTSSNSKTTLPDDEQKIEHETLIALFTSLRQGLTVRNWCLENLDLLHGIDVRRLITFGLIKGLLYRVHKYAIATSPAGLTSVATSGTPMQIRKTGEGQALRNGTQTPLTTRGRERDRQPSISTTREDTETVKDARSARDERDDASVGLPLVKFLDGMHCFDEICTELGIPERDLEEKVRGIGGVEFVYR